jgi:hypothetical protein
MIERLGYTVQAVAESLYNAGKKYAQRKRKSQDGLFRHEMT